MLGGGKNLKEREKREEGEVERLSGWERERERQGGRGSNYLADACLLATLVLENNFSMG